MAMEQTWASSQPQAVTDYMSALGAYQNLDQHYANMGLTPQQAAGMPDIQSGYQSLLGQYNALPGLNGTERKAVAAPYLPHQASGFMGGGLGSLVKLGLPVAASFALPGLGSALGASLGIGTTAGTALAGAGVGGLTSALTGGKPLTGALTGALGGAVSGSGLFNDLSKSLCLNDLFGGTSLSTPSLGSLSPSAGGSAGGFDFGSSTGDWADGLRAAGTSAASSSPSFFADPLGYLGDSLSSGASKMFDPSNLLKTGLKYGLSSALASDPYKGFAGVTTAANNAAGLYQPYYQAGTAANGALSNALGLNGPGAAQAAFQSFQADPGFQFARDQGIKSLDASAARNGMLISGNNQQAVQGYGTGLANQYFQQYLQNLSGVSGQGAQAAGQIGQNTIDAATAAALAKAGKANQGNQLLGGALSALFS